MLVAVYICVPQHLAYLLIAALLADALQKNLQVLKRDQAVLIQIHYCESQIEFFLDCLTIHLAIFIQCYLSKYFWNWS